MANAIELGMAREVAQLQLELKKRQWLSAVRWRQRVKACLASSGLSFSEWLVLDAAWSLMQRTGEAVSQSVVGKELDLDDLAVWHALAVLDHRGLVSRSRSISGKAWRVFVTGTGEALLRAVQPGLEGASALSA